MYFVLEDVLFSQITSTKTKKLFITWYGNSPTSRIHVISLTVSKIHLKT